MNILYTMHKRNAEALSIHIYIYMYTYVEFVQQLEEHEAVGCCF